MKKSFKNYLLERAVDSEPDYSAPAELEEAVDVFLKYCKDALWMVEKDTPLYRGQKRITGDFVVVDTSATERKSQNTSNFYTTILDNILPNSFPRRSKSFICSTSAEKADFFGDVYIVDYTKMKAATTSKNLKSLMEEAPFGGTEMWVGGKCLMLNSKNIDNFKEMVLAK